MDQWKEGGDKRIQQWTNYNGAIGILHCWGLTAESLIAKDQSANLPEQSKFAKRRLELLHTIL